MEVYIKLLRNTFYRNFLLASTLLNIGRKLSWVALGWFVYQVTGSALSIGIVITAASISPLLSSVFVGGILDQYDRRKIMILENMTRGIFLALIPVMFWMDILSMWMIVAVVTINGILSSFTTIGTASILPEFLSKDDLESGNAVFTMTGQIGSLIGPALGGLCTAWVGAPMTLLFNVFAFFAASLLYFLIPNVAYGSREPSSGQLNTFINNKVKTYFKEVKSGFDFIVRFKILIVIALVTFFFNLTYAPLEPMLPIFVDDIVQGGPEVLGLMWTFFSIGSLIGALSWVKLGKKIPYSYSLGAIIMLWGIAQTSLGFSRTSIIVFIVMFFGGIVYAPYNIVAPTLRQRLVPNELRGRVFGVYGLIAGLGFPIGVYFGGLFGEYANVITTIIVSGISTIILGSIVFLHPILRITEVNTLPHPEQNRSA